MRAWSPWPPRAAGVQQHPAGPLRLGQTQFFLLLGCPTRPIPSGPSCTGEPEQGTLAGYWCGLLIPSVLAAATAVTCWPSCGTSRGTRRPWTPPRAPGRRSAWTSWPAVSSRPMACWPLREAVPARTRLAQVFEARPAPGHSWRRGGPVEARVGAAAGALVPGDGGQHAGPHRAGGNFFGLGRGRAPDSGPEAGPGPAGGTPSPRVLPPASGTETSTVQLGAGRTDVEHLRCPPRAADGACSRGGRPMIAPGRC